MGLAVKVAWFPDLAPGARHLQRRVRERRGQGIAPGLLQSRKVYRGLEQGPGRAPGVQGAVETGVAHLAPTHQGRHFAAVKAGDHGSRLQLA